jgi:hypothetical protein
MSRFGDPAFFGDRYAHEYDERTVLDPAPAVEFLAGLVPLGARVVELAVGTGRVGIPLAARGEDERVDEDDDAQGRRYLLLQDEAGEGHVHVWIDARDAKRRDYARCWMDYSGT